MAEVSSKMKEQDKDPVDILIIAGGAIVGAIILYGFVTSVIYIMTIAPQTTVTTETGTQSVSDSSSVSLTSSSCAHCVGLEDNNTRQTITYPGDITLELPQKDYPKSNLLLFGNPEGTLRLVGDATPVKQGDWAVVLHTEKQGVADIIVEATTDADYHVSFTIQ